MLQLMGESVSLCDGISRRGFLGVGSLGLAGLTLPQVLAARQAQAATARKDTAVILFYMAGGPSHLDTYDMKPTAPEINRGPFRPISTNAAGIDVCELMPRHARVADRMSIVRSITHNLSVHDDGAHWIFTGYPLLNARARGQQYPAQGAVVAQQRGANAPGMPAYVCIPEAPTSDRGFYEAPAFLSPKYRAVNAGGDPALGNFRRPDFHLRDELGAARIDMRQDLLSQIDRLQRTADHGNAFESMDLAQQQAFDLVTGARAREAFDVSRESDAVRDRYGRHAYGHGALLARRLVEAGVTFVTINLYEADVDWWDDHTTIEKNLRARLPKFDQAVATVIEDLTERGLIDRVLVAAFGEFGRSPNVDAGAGRGHWPRAMSAMLAGGGVQGGRVIGSTTSNGGEPASRPLAPGDLLQSIYHVLGIDRDTMLIDRQNRPIRLVESGEPIDELF
jgi:hypothetical protein